MPNRILKESICTSQDIEQLTPEEEVLFYRILVNCDDFGCMDGRPQIIKSRCYPLKADDISYPEIVDWLASLIESNLIILYIIDDHPYIKVTGWEKHQQVRATKPRFPLPSNGCKQLHADDIYAVLLPTMEYNSARIRIRNSIRNRNTLLVPPQPPQSNDEWDGLFEELYEVYPKHYPNEKPTIKSWIIQMLMTGELSPEKIKTDIIPAIKEMSKTEKWQIRNHQYVPAIIRFFRETMWEQGLQLIEEREKKEKQWPVR